MTCNITPNKSVIAVVVVCYNRPWAAKRLLDSLNAANYPECDVPLIISVDCSGNEDMYSLAIDFEWKHGKKYANIEKERLGLKKHIFQCASLAKYFKGVIILEDDIFVSPFFYHYAVQSLEKYGEDERVAGIALYKNEYQGFAGVPLQYVNNGNDVFACQSVCSWGELWNDRMWTEFSSWLGEWDKDFARVDMPNRIKNWSRAWSKYVYAYLVETDKYYIYPYESVTTNFNDAGGEHGGGNKSIVQVSLLQGKRNYHLGDFANLEKYDVYSQNKSIPEWLNIEQDDLTVDFYGLKNVYKGHYILAPFEMPFSKVKGFSLSLRPWELNIKYGIGGNELFLYYRDNNDEIIPKRRIPMLSTASYFMRDFNFSLIQKYLKLKVESRVKRLLAH